MGTPDFALPAFREIKKSENLIIAVVTQPDRPKGRGLKTTESSVKQWAKQENLHIIQPSSAKEPEFIEKVQQLKPDLIVTAAYGQIIPLELLRIPHLGCINVHASLLPEYRGASPIQHAILDGKQTTGITIFFMNQGMDTGDIILQLQAPILPEDNAQDLHDRLALLSAKAIEETLEMFQKGRPVAYPQDNQKASYCKKIDSDMGRIDWTKEATKIVNHIRAMTPWPGAYCMLENKQIKIVSAVVVNFEGYHIPGSIVVSDERSGIVVACGEGFLRLTKLQKSGGKVLSDNEFLRGNLVALKGKQFI